MHIHRAWSPDKKPMTPNRILEMASMSGNLSISWHYRNNAVRQKCDQMVAARLLKRKRCSPGSGLYIKSSPKACVYEIAKLK